jgi:uncharacterized protein YfiM (DUF2279 family)
MFVWTPLLIALCFGPTDARGHAAAPILYATPASAMPPTNAVPPILLATSAPATLPPIPPIVVIDTTDAARDPWFAEDKVRHFFMSFAATSFAYGAARTAGLDHGPAEVAAGVGAAAAGVWKEFHDRSRGRSFSFPDLAWDGLGIAAALILAAQTR